jgi:flagellin
MEGFIMSSNTVVRTNGMSNIAHTALKAQGNALNKSSQRLATGKKVNSAADDAAGLAISDKMTAQIRGLDMASKNTEDGVSLIQTAESNVGEINNMVQRIRELAVQAANGTLESGSDATGYDRQKIQDEVDQLTDEINAMASRAQFNKLKLNSTTTVTFQVGANKGETVGLKLSKIDATALTLNSTTAKLDTQSGAQALIETCDNALTTVESYRARLGAMQNRLEFTDSNLQSTSNNLQDARSGIEDADMATEMSNYTSANVLQQAATSMLAQANQSTQNILSLLG